MPRDPRGRRWQFSIRIMLLAATLCALAVASWKTFIWQRPTHRIASYEQAPMFYGRTAKIGPNQIRIETPVRGTSIRDCPRRLEGGRDAGARISTTRSSRSLGRRHLRKGVDRR